MATDSQPLPAGTDGIIRDAMFSRDGVRLRLTRAWQDGGRRPLVIGHNPSDAGADREDPTTHRLNHFFRAWGHRGYDLVNLYPWVTSDPEQCRDIARNGNVLADQLDNMKEIRRLAPDAPMVLAAFGDLPEDPHWVTHVLFSIRESRHAATMFHCLGTTASGNPKHPMARGTSRVPNDQQPIVWKTI